MKAQSNKRMAVAAALAAAFAFGPTGNAFAAQATGAVGGTVTDTSSAGNANGGGLPQIQHQGDVSYVSGGVGQDESKALERQQRQHAGGVLLERRIARWKIVPAGQISLIANATGSSRGFCF